MQVDHADHYGNLDAVCTFSYLRSKYKPSLRTEPMNDICSDATTDNIFNDGNKCQEYTQRGGVRPFGVSLLAAGLEADMATPALYQIDPSGTYFQWRATAIGKNYVSAKSFLEKRWSQDMEIEDGIHTALLTLREGFEGEMTCHNIEVGIVTTSEKVFRTLTATQIQDYLDEAN